MVAKDDSTNKNKKVLSFGYSEGDFLKLWHRTEKPLRAELRRSCFKFGFDDSKLEDVMQETVLIVWRKNCNGEVVKFRAYSGVTVQITDDMYKAFYCFVRTTFLRLYEAELRQHSCRQLVPVKTTVPSEDDPWSFVHEGQLPFRRGSKNESLIHEVLEMTREILSSAMQDAVYMYFKGNTMCEIAARLRVNRQTAKRRIAHVIERLKREARLRGLSDSDNCGGLAS